MSAAEWTNLPELLRRSEAMRILGVSRDGLECLAKNMTGLCVVLPGMKHRRFRKTMLARLTAGEYPNDQVGQK